LIYVDFWNIQVVIGVECKGYVQCAEGPNQPLCSMCASSLCLLAAALLLQGQAKWNEMKLSLASFFVVDTIDSLFLPSMSLEWQPTSWLNLPVAPRNRRENSGHRLCIIMVCLALAANCYMLIYAHCRELVMSVRCHGSLSLLFMMNRMTVWHFVSSNFHKVIMTALSIVWLTNWHCCGLVSVVWERWSELCVFASKVIRELRMHMRIKNVWIADIHL
jgi:hypothetical protein